MIGVVFGNLKGFAPALELELSYKAFDFYTENEYVIDHAGGMYNFFYTWNELGFSPVERFIRGIFAEYSFWKLTAGVHYFNPFSKEYFFIASLNFEL